MIKIDIERSETKPYFSLIYHFRVDMKFASVVAEIRYSRMLMLLFAFVIRVQHYQALFDS
jgi:hypothetical protein